MWEEYVRGAAAPGILRRMLPICPVGEVLNTLRDNVSGGGGYLDALRTISEEYFCDQYGSCLECKVGQEALMDLMSSEGATVVEGGLEVFNHYAEVGFDRKFPSQCEEGRRLQVIFLGVREATLDPEAMRAIIDGSDTAGCLDRAGCTLCDIGLELLVSDLTLLTQEGIDAVRGEWSSD